MLKKGNIVTLSNKQKYVVVYITKYKDEEYCYIINEVDDNDSMICKILPNKSVEIVTDEKIINIFLQLFTKDFISKKEQ